MGTGDGRGALALAASAGPASLVLGVDAAAATMAETSRRAAKSAPNLIFLAASAEAFACELPSVADRLVVTFPWASLLRGVLGLDADVSRALAAIVGPAGRMSALVSVTPRDGLDGVPYLDDRSVSRLVPPPGLRLVDACPATGEEVLATRSTWGRRLLSGGPGTTRPVWRLEWQRDG
jgi:16S rRNA (adenine(1408)-N(1))-methyltransferase